MNQVVTSAPFLDWWLPLVLFLLGAGLAFTPPLRRGRRDEREEAAPAASGVQTYQMAARSAPRLPPAASVESASVLPFGETAERGTLPISVDMATPVSPETPAPAAVAEPVPVSPETPTPDVPSGVLTEVVEEGPSQRLPVDRTLNASSPAPELNHMAHTEYADPDAAVAKKEPPAALPPNESMTAPQRTTPEKDVIAEKTAAPQQPYEAEKVGAITPEQAGRIMDDHADNAHDSDVPVVTEAASAGVTALERDGEGVVGSADDLTKLNGVGQKSAAALRAAGIDSFQKLANSSDDTIRAALNSAGVRLVGDVVTWSQQAAYAARGDWDGLKQFNAERRAANGD
jgi:predicted flap endonuclease-1-like 5' DNA nuclease